MPLERRQILTSGEHSKLTPLVRLQNPFETMIGDVTDTFRNITPAVN